MSFKVINYEPIKPVSQGPLRGRFDILCLATGIILRQWRYYDGLRGESIRGPYIYLKQLNKKVRYHDFNNDQDFLDFQERILDEVRQITNGEGGCSEKVQRETV